jgi:hypothetical protein
MRIATLVGGAVVTAALSGCAHPMIISPDVETLVPKSDVSRIPKNAGLYMAPADRASQVTTPGGGGDKVSYHPYADMEIGLYKMLGNVFQSVTMLTSPTDTTLITKNSVAYIVAPKIATTSSSSGFFTWMATDFTVTLTCTISDAAGRSIATVSSTGSGHAVFDELKSNFSIAGQRAAQDALLKEQVLLLENAELRK